MTIALLGGNGGEVSNLADITIVVPALETQRIQEVQLLVIHLLGELVEGQLLTTPTNESGGSWDSYQLPMTSDQLPVIKY